ncbi:hypothetical protein N7448_006341 [Penicillium atrosanguineum]|uniref:Uncharacterized protein n=1 Tax=Penicillium atrosanguineum TaxID=1132637 RepID=A0A9W9U3I4_9EURO|nr:uncharacterized protein N7443_010101 [Penicillium atrosanguineum]KAJ5132183.1 hypothetical protein N7448_006341 [Penicillium atrosanguineum]KAJ5137607.1 hypothetical protein N7526_003840 [Penicillium atrosanguineum]KAJ5289848.1 hypothetical protein N7443_010101 [Penicillium atrosanguineum]KAJ5307671.1 hypothetical protein N7476_008327 [Penicillium atrosanguineum]
MISQAVQAAQPGATAVADGSEGLPLPPLLPLETLEEKGGWLEAAACRPSRSFAVVERTFWKLTRSTGGEQQVNRLSSRAFSSWTASNQPEAINLLQLQARGVTRTDFNDRRSAKEHADPRR